MNSTVAFLWPKKGPIKLPFAQTRTFWTYVAYPGTITVLSRQISSAMFQYSAGYIEKWQVFLPFNYVLKLILSVIFSKYLRPQDSISMILSFCHRQNTPIHESHCNNFPKFFESTFFHPNPKHIPWPNLMIIWWLL